MDFTGKTVIVTGAGAGMGRAAALGFARLGASLVVNSVSDSAAKVRDELTAQVFGLVDCLLYDIGKIRTRRAEVNGCVPLAQDIIDSFNYLCFDIDVEVFVIDLHRVAKADRFERGKARVFR